MVFSPEMFLLLLFCMAIITVVWLNRWNTTDVCSYFYFLRLNMHDKSRPSKIWSLILYSVVINCPILRKSNKRSCDGKRLYLTNTQSVLKRNWTFCIELINNWIVGKLFSDTNSSQKRIILLKNVNMVKQKILNKFWLF